MIEKVKEYKTVNKKGRFRRGIIEPFLITALPKNVATILDVGCGTGEYHQLIFKERETITKLIGIDLSKEILESAVKTDKSQYLCMDSLNIQLEEKFDCILAIFLI